MNPLTVKKLSTNKRVLHLVHNPDSTTAVIAGAIDMRDFRTGLISFLRTIGTGHISTMKLVASETADMANPVDIKNIDLTEGQPDTVGDYIFSEFITEEIAQIGTEKHKALRYIGLSITMDTATDEGIVTFILDDARFRSEGLTTNFIQ